jgi:hypothetical protein
MKSVACEASGAFPGRGAEAGAASDCRRAAISDRGARGNVFSTAGWAERAGPLLFRFAVGETGDGSSDADWCGGFVVGGSGAAPCGGNGAGFTQSLVAANNKLRPDMEITPNERTKIWSEAGNLFIP